MHTRNLIIPSKHSSSVGVMARGKLVHFAMYIAMLNCHSHPPSLALAKLIYHTITLVHSFLEDKVHLMSSYIDILLCVCSYQFSPRNIDDAR